MTVVVPMMRPHEPESIAPVPTADVTESIVAPQALFLMNDPLVTKLAAALAERVARESAGGTDRDRIARLYQIALARLPTEAEVEIGLQFLASQPQPSAWTSTWMGNTRFCCAIPIC